MTQFNAENHVSIVAPSLSPDSFSLSRGTSTASLPYDESEEYAFRSAFTRGQSARSTTLGDLRRGSKSIRQRFTCTRDVSAP